MTAALGCGGLTCLLSPPPFGGHLKRKRHIMTTVAAHRKFVTHHANETPARDPMQEFANRIISELENGVKPWVRPWDPEKAGGPQSPFNPTTGARYHGINVHPRHGPSSFPER